jgi:hypothetical protein
MSSRCSFGMPYAPRSKVGVGLQPFFLVLALALFDCRGGSKENYRSFSIIFLSQGIASLLHDKLLPAFLWYFWIYSPSTQYLGGLVYNDHIIFIH